MEDKTNLLKKWLEKKENNATKSDGLQKAPDGVSIPLSYRQERLWFLQQLYPGNPFYHYAEGYELDGPLNIGSFLQSIRSTIERQSVLRSAFKVIDGKVIQFTKDSAEFEYSLFDFSRIQDTDDEFDKILIKETHKPFDLGEGPLLRVTLVKYSERHHLVVFTIHHLIMDKWSMRLIRDELFNNYISISQNEPLRSVPLEIEYKDYAYWQRTVEVDKDHLNYWRNQLDGSSQLHLPFTKRRSGHSTFEGGLCNQIIAVHLKDAIIDFSRQTGVTLYVFFLTVYKVLLHRLCQEDDIVVGSPVTERSQAALEQVVGFFDDMIVLRSDLSNDPGFSELLQQVKSTVLEAFEHKDVPFEQIVKSINPERLLSLNPLFQVMFIFHEEIEPSFESDIIKVDKRILDIGVAKFDLTLYVELKNEEITVNFEYSKDVFEKEAIEKFLSYYVTLLNEIMVSPEKPISDYNFLSELERVDILSTGKGASLSLSDEKTVCHLLAQTVQQSPDATAVSCSGQQITYRTLAVRSDAVMKLLKNEGVTRNDTVGLCTGRTIGMVVGIFGILKAGAGYVAIDPGYPEGRARYILNEVGAAIVLADGHCQLTTSSLGSALQIIDIQSIEESSEVIDSQTYLKDMGGEQLAYVIYTSGSTGQPKGIKVSHTNLLNSTLARNHYYSENPQSFLLLSPYTFDSSIAGIFWTLATGGKLVIPPKRIEQDTDFLGQLIADEQVTHTLLLPSLYQALLQYVPLVQLNSLKAVIVAGESCPIGLDRLHFQNLPEVRLYNEYGPSETTVWSTVYEITENENLDSVPIGNPIANTDTYVLDKYSKLLPAGIHGELCIGGAGVAGGYVHNDELTANRFIENPYSNVPGSRLYRTGDIVSFDKLRGYLFHGRKDNQVKIRGHRIELEEVKGMLGQYDGIDEAVVIVGEEGDDGVTDQSQIERVSTMLKTYNKQEAEDVLQSVKGLSDEEVRILLNEME